MDARRTTDDAWPCESGWSHLDSDSTLAAIALATSLVLFAIASLAEASVASASSERVRRLVSGSAGPVPGSAALERLFTSRKDSTRALSLLRAVALSGSLLSATGLVIAITGVQWVTISLASIAVLAFLGIIHRVTLRLALAYGERIALKLAPLARGLAWLANPMFVASDVLVRRLLPGDRPESLSASDLASGELSLGMGSDGEPFDEREVKMIRGVVRLDTTIAREIMVPRVDMVAVEVSTGIHELAEQMIEGGHSRIPVYRGDLDHMEGIAYARDILRHVVQNEDTLNQSIEGVIRPAIFIPESKTLEELLGEFQETRVHMAIVVDEYGGVSGIVTIEDLLEEIVGEIQDEFDAWEPEIEPVGQNEFLLNAQVSIDRLNALLNTSVESGGFDTLGGYVYDRLGRIPSTGDSIEHDGLKIEVLSTVGRRLNRLKITKSAD